MADADASAPLNQDECREPALEDLVKLCRALNQVGAHYVVIGGFAMRAAGFIRSTMDVDLLVETGPQNESRIIEALMTLPDQAVRQIKPGEVEKYGVVRVADEILVDLMKSGGGVTYGDAIQDAAWHEIDGVRVPFASPRTLWRMKQTPRERDIPDRLFLRKLLEAQGVDLAPPASASQALPRWLQWLGRLLTGKTKRP